MLVVQTAPGHGVDAASSSATSTARASAGSPRASRRSRTPTSRSWPTREHVRLLRLLALGWVFHMKMLIAVGLQRRARGRLPALLRDDRLLHVPRGRRPEAAPLRVARRRRDGDLVGDEHLRGRRRMQRERWHGTLELLVAAPTHFSLRPPAGDDRDGDDRHLQHGRDAALGLARLRDRSARSSIRWRSCSRSRPPSCRSARWASCSPWRSSASAQPGRSGTCSSIRSGSICGFLVPLSLFPGWVRPISWVLAPTWGINAIREAALGGSPLADIGMCGAARLRLHAARHRRSSTAPCAPPA